jgi:hypothetical protein
VQVNKWGIILCADLLVKRGFVGQDLPRIAMDGERRGLGCGFPYGAEKLPVLEKSRGVGGYLKTCPDLFYLERGCEILDATDFDEFLCLLDYFYCVSGECA